MTCLLDPIPFASLLMSQMVTRYLADSANDDSPTQDTDKSVLIGETVLLFICLLIVVVYECFYRKTIVGWGGKPRHNNEPASLMRKVFGILANLVKAAMLAVPPALQWHGTVTSEDKGLLAPLVPAEPSEFNKEVWMTIMPLVVQTMFAQYHLFCGTNLHD